MSGIMTKVALPGCNQHTYVVDVAATMKSELWTAEILSMRTGSHSNAACLQHEARGRRKNAPCYQYSVLCAEGPSRAAHLRFTV